MPYKMLEIIANDWVHRLHSFFGTSQFWPYFPNLWKDFHIDDQQMKNIEIKNTDVLVGHLIIFWATLYLIFKKCLNSLLRRMRFPLMQRKRIIEAIWSCGFCFGSICYLISPSLKTLSFSTHGWKVTHQDLGVVLHKSFHFHRAGISILSNGVWMRGLVDLFFASFVLISYQEKWCASVNTFLYYKAIDTLVINVCRILTCMSRNNTRKIAKFLFTLHCLNWIYLYICLAPKTILWPEKSDYTRVEIGLKLWFAAEVLDSVWLKLCGCAKAVHWLEICIFPPPTQEAIELASIQKKHGEPSKLINTKRPKIELFQKKIQDFVKRKQEGSLDLKDSKKSKSIEMFETLLCAMTIKKKIKKMRLAKQNKSESSMNDKQDEIINDIETDTINSKETETVNDTNTEIVNNIEAETINNMKTEIINNTGTEIRNNTEIDRINYENKDDKEIEITKEDIKNYSEK